MIRKAQLKDVEAIQWLLTKLGYPVSFYRLSNARWANQLEEP